MTPEEVKYIRESDLTYKELAEDFKISPTLVRRIKIGERYGYIE